MHINYVGHCLVAGKRPGLPDITLPERAMKRIKRRVARIIYIHLLQHRRGPKGHMSGKRIGHGFVDWDLVTCVSELRKYLYGGISEAELGAFLEGTARLPYVRGLMGFLPLITKIDQLKELDGWMVSVLRRAQRERVRVAKSHGLTVQRLPEAMLISGSWYSHPELAIETQLPSFVRAWRGSKKFYRKYGLSGVNSRIYYTAVSP
ncbi:MAG: hypothetical protein ACREEB_10545, partial [Caulobacteraceae bacterium]